MSLAARLASPLGLLLLWQVLSSAGVLPTRILASPAQIGDNIEACGRRTLMPGRTILGSPGDARERHT